MAPITGKATAAIASTIQPRMTAGIRSTVKKNTMPAQMSANAVRFALRSSARPRTAALAGPYACNGEERKLVMEAGPMEFRRQTVSQNAKIDLDQGIAGTRAGFRPPTGFTVRRIGYVGQSRFDIERCRTIMRFGFVDCRDSSG